MNIPFQDNMALATVVKKELKTQNLRFEQDNNGLWCAFIRNGKQWDKITAWDNDRCLQEIQLRGARWKVELEIEGTSFSIFLAAQ